MSEPDFGMGDLGSKRVIIVGIGLIGGSLAYCLQGKCAQLLGVDPDPDVVARASAVGIFDELALDLTMLDSPADLLILCAPVNGILQILQELPGMHAGSAIVLDTGSTKFGIVEMMRGLPERFIPIGGHPMCGKETGGFQHADRGLFKGATFALVEPRQIPVQARMLIEDFVHLTGGYPLWLDAKNHDHWAAATSHLPYLAALSLAGVVPIDASLLVGPGFRSATRLAATPPRMMIDVLQSNRSNLLAAIADFKREIFIVESLLADGDDRALAGWLEAGRAKHAELLHKQDQGISGGR